MIELTDQAIIKLVERNVNSVRVGITGGGCAGFEYIFAEDQVRNGDEVIDYGKFNILIKISLRFTTFRCFLGVLPPI